MSEPRRLELAWLFGIYARATPAPNGGDMSFAFDGATFTPGEFVADSGSRDVDIELTLSGAAITSGTLGALAILTSDIDFDGDTEARGFNIGSSPATTFYLTEDNMSSKMPLLIIPAVDGHCKTTLTILNDGVAASDVYISVFLPSGAMDSSDAISIPGVGE